MKGEKSKRDWLYATREICYNAARKNFFKKFLSSSWRSKQQVDYLYKTMAETFSRADYIYQQSKLHPSSANILIQIGKSLKTIASLIFSISIPRYIMYPWEVLILMSTRTASKKDCLQN